MKSLAIDIGNTRIKAAVFDGLELIDLYQGKTEEFRSWMDGWDDGRIKHGIVSSTSTSPLLLAGLAHIEIMELTHHTSVPLDVKYETPDTLGRDRIAGVVAAHALFSGRNALVIDLGTCVTYDFVTADGVFKGGNIAPGLDMRFRSMHEYTARLPLEKRSHSNALIGRSTSSALQLGVQNGIQLEIEGYIRRLESEYGQLVVVLTGGDSVYFAERLKTEIFVRPNLVLIGLNEILRYNVA